MRVKGDRRWRTLSSRVGLGRLLSQEKGVVVARELWQWLWLADMVEKGDCEGGGVQ